MAADNQYQDQYSPENDRRRELFGVLEGAIMHEDYSQTTVNNVAGELAGDDLSRVVELADYMEIRREGITDNGAVRTRWNIAIEGYFKSIPVDQLTAEKAEIVSSLRSDTQWELLLSGIEVDEAPVISNDHEQPHNQDEEEDKLWDQDSFTVRITGSELSEIRDSDVFKRAEGYASGDFGKRLGDMHSAVLHINGEPNLVKRAWIRKFIDQYVFKHAENLATGNIYVNRVEMEQAMHAVCTFASEDSDIRDRMYRALDKHVFSYARRHVVPDTDELPANKEAARAIVNKYASSPGRAKAMLRELDLL